MICVNILGNLKWRNIPLSFDLYAKITKLILLSAQTKYFIIRPQRIIPLKSSLWHWVSQIDNSISSTLHIRWKVGNVLSPHLKTSSTASQQIYVVPSLLESSYSMCRWKHHPPSNVPHTFRCRFLRTFELNFALVENTWVREWVSLHSDDRYFNVHSPKVCETTHYLELYKKNASRGTFLGAARRCELCISILDYFLSFHMPKQLFFFYNGFYLVHFSIWLFNPFNNNHSYGQNIDMEVKVCNS